MNTLSDTTQELLSAWVDGALDEQQASEVQASLSRSPELQRQLGLMMVNERRLRSEVHRMVAERPVPAALSALLEEPEVQERQTLAQRVQEWLQPSGFGPGLVAASVVAALIVGVFTGNQMGPSSEVTSHSMALADMTIGPGDASFNLLETQVAGEPLDLGDRIQGQVAFSFQSSDGRWCRQFERHDLESTQSVAAIACRDADVWQVELMQTIHQPLMDAGHFRAASGSELESLDIFVMQRSAGEVLVGAPEAALIQRGWR
jgi:hypothetical protein